MPRKPIVPIMPRIPPVTSRAREEEYVLRTGQVAAMAGVVPSTVVRWANDGILPCRRLPSPKRERRYAEADVRALLENMRMPEGGES